MHELMRPAGVRMHQTRPEIIGGLMCKAEDGDYVDTIYVTSGARADDGEKVDIPADLCPPMKEGRRLMDQVSAPPRGTRPGRRPRPARRSAPGSTPGR